MTRLMPRCNFCAVLPVDTKTAFGAPAEEQMMAATRGLGGQHAQRTTDGTRKETHTYISVAA